MAQQAAATQPPKAAVKFLATKILESLDSGDISHNDLYTWLSDAINDYGMTNGSYACLIDFIGDGESGDVIFRCGGDLKKAPYSIETVNGKVTAQLDDENVVDVLPHTIYEEEADEADHYASMESAKLYTHGAELPLCERFISKDARDAADSSSFAGKGKSFPILKPGDVMAAVRSMGRAGPGNYGAGTLRSNIIRIAKAKGFTSSLPKAWQSGGDDAKESAALVDAMLADFSARLAEAAPAGGAKKAAQAMHDNAKGQKAHDAAVKLGANCPDDCKFGDDDDNGADASESARIAGLGARLRESAALSTNFEFREAAAISPLVKIISPGRGSSGYYTKEVLERDGPKVFGRGTLMFINHATEAEQKSRPEGDWTKLAAVTEAAAKWNDNGPEGPALYAPAAVFSKYAEEVKEKAPFTGVSINAYGQYAESATGLANPKVKFDESKTAPDGKPGLIAKLTAADSIDLVTKAGRDGKLLLESAERVPQTTTNQEELDMAENQQLKEALAEIRKLKERGALSDAGGAIAEYFRTIQVGEGVKRRVTERLLAGTIPLTTTGELDRAKLKEFAQAQVTDELTYLRELNPGIVRGMGAGLLPAAAAPTAEALKEAKKAEKKALKETSRRFASLMGFGDGLTKAGRRILTEGRGAFDVNYNSREHGATVQSGGTLPPVGGA